MHTPRLGRPPTFTADDVVDAGAAVGLAELTVSAVAERLGVSVPAIYRHVTDRDDLARRVAQRLLADLALPADAGQDPADYLVEVFVRLRGLLVAHPGLALLHLRVWDLPAIRQRSATVTALLAARGIERAAAELLHYDLTCFTLAFVATEGLEETDVPTDPRLDGVGPDRMFRWTLGLHAHGLVDAVRRGDLPWS